MKSKIIIANWKMNLSVEQEESLMAEFARRVKKIEGEVVVCPSFLGLRNAEKLLKGKVAFGSQDVFWREAGAYTGEVSARYLADIGCRYVIVGHSERRQNVGETDEMVNKKVSTCLRSGLMPIVCVGETEAEKRAGQTDNKILRQLHAAFKDIELVPAEEIIIAYEPLWAIGSGQAVDLETAEHVFRLIRQTTYDLWPATIAKTNVRLVYGGSVNAENAAGFMSLGLVSGFLVGGASLDADGFFDIIKVTL